MIATALTPGTYAAGRHLSAAFDVPDADSVVVVTAERTTWPNIHSIRLAALATATGISQTTIDSVYAAIVAGTTMPVGPRVAEALAAIRAEIRARNMEAIKVECELSLDGGASWLPWVGFGVRGGSGAAQASARRGLPARTGRKVRVEMRAAASLTTEVTVGTS